MGLQCKVQILLKQNVLLALLTELDFPAVNISIAYGKQLCESKLMREHLGYYKCNQITIILIYF